MVFDALSEVLRAIRLKGAVFFDVEATSPWRADSPPGHILGRAIMPGVEHVIDFHVVTRGECWAELADRPGKPVRLGAGDVIAFPQGDAHRLSSSADMCSISATPRPDIAAIESRLPVRVTVGSDPNEGSVRLMCGFLACDARPFNPLLGSLPPLIHLPAVEGNGRIEQFSAFAKSESERPRTGSASLLAKVGELMFIDLVRRHVDGLPDDAQNWLAGLKDQIVGRALALIHEGPAEHWTLDELARRTGASRSSLAERFTRYAGMPPMQYLKNWRMQLASAMLSDTGAPIRQISGNVGYESEEAFSRAFKRIVGVSPRDWREARLVSPLGQSQGEAGPQR